MIKVFVFFVVLAGAILAVRGEDDIVSDLVSKRNSAPNGVIALNTASYKKYVLRARNYHVFVLFTATNSPCHGCKLASNAIDAVGDTIRRAYGSVVEGAQMSRLFVMKADFPKCQEIFHMHPNLTGVPHLAYIPPGPEVIAPPEALQKSTKWLPGFSAKNEYQITSQEVDGQDILNWLHVRTKETKKKLDLWTDPWPNIIRFLFVLLTVPTSFFALMFAVGPKRFLLLFSLAMISFILAGGMWVLIRGAHWNDPGSGDWIVRYNGSQHILEGVWVGVLCFVGGMLTVGLNNKKLFTSYSPYVGNLAVFMLTGGLAISFLALRRIYVTKNHGYLVYAS